LFDSCSFSWLIQRCGETSNNIQTNNIHKQQQQTFVRQRFEAVEMRERKARRIPQLVAKMTIRHHTIHIEIDRTSLSITHTHTHTQQHQHQQQQHQQQQHQQQDTKRHTCDMYEHKPKRSASVPHSGMPLG
jgi:hypothetical protein